MKRSFVMLLHVARKQYRVYTDKGHDVWPDHEEFAFPWLREHLGLE